MTEAGGGVPREDPTWPSVTLGLGRAARVWVCGLRGDGPTPVSWSPPHSPYRFTRQETTLKLKMSLILSYGLWSPAKALNQKLET